MVGNNRFASRIGHENDESYFTTEADLLGKCIRNDCLRIVNLSLSITVVGRELQAFRYNNMNYEIGRGGGDTKEIHGKEKSSILVHPRKRNDVMGSLLYFKNLFFDRDFVNGIIFSRKF